MEHTERNAGTNRIGRRRLLVGIGGAGFAMAFASACRSGSEAVTATTLAGPSTDESATPVATTAISVGIERASTASMIGTNPFDDYRYENTATGTEVRIWIEDGIRRIEANGLPDHVTGTFPNRANPNTISAQAHSFEVAANPVVTGRSTPNGILDVFGIAINGVPFDPGAAGFWNDDRSAGWQVEPLSDAINLGEDASNAHVQGDGTYHYHGVPEGMVSDVSNGEHSPLVGFAPDGFPIYARTGYVDASNPSSGITLLRSSYQLKSGTRPSGPGGAYDGTYVADYGWVSGLGELDENNGRVGVTPEYPGGTYYYVLTDGFPFIPRSFAGVPDAGFSRGLASGNPAGNGRPVPPSP